MHQVPPLIAITMGDPSGIGPEIVVKALCEKIVFAQCRPVVIGDERILAFTIQWLKVPPLQINKIDSPTKGMFKRGFIDLIRVTDLSPEEISLGKPQALGGEAAYRYVEKGVKMAIEGVVDAIVTAPISKEAINAAGHPYAGHTELLAEMTSAQDYVMMLAGPRLRVSLVTRHVAIRLVASVLSPELIKRTIIITADALRSFWGIDIPRLAVAGLNPHAGEGGLFGEEEESIITPAVMDCRRMGIRVEGPLPSDSLFFRAAAGEYDAVISMYHDQGLIPLKLLHFREGVNITLGLPIIRTSVDHGTGYDIAGQGVADSTSLVNAIVMASQMVRHRTGG